MMMRWLFFFIAVLSVTILTTFKEPYYQAFGWAFSFISCTGWMIIALQDKDYPRMLMEMMYGGYGIWGAYNWLS